MFRKEQSRGFSLVELMVVLAVTMIVAGMAIPKIMNSIYDIRLRSAATNVTGLLQDARFRAIRSNTFYAVKSTVVGNSTVFYVDVNGDGSWQNTEPAVQMGGNVYRSTSNPDSAGTSKPWGFPAPDPSKDAYFGPRGLPCVVSGSVCVQSKSGGAGVSVMAAYLVVLTDNRPVGSPSYLSISISPGGRVKVWRWTGTAWI